VFWPDWAYIQSSGGNRSMYFAEPVVPTPFRFDMPLAPFAASSFALQVGRNTSGWLFFSEMLIYGDARAACGCG
jgi:hypothetical protein